MMDAGIGKTGSVTLTRRLNPDRTMIFTEGRFTGLFEAWLQHVRLWEDEPDHLSTIMMRQGLAAAGLVMANRPACETMAWTINLLRPPMILFITGDCGKGNITGRIHSGNVNTQVSNRLYTEVVRPGREPHLTSIRVNGLDILLHFEQYYRASEQHPARFFELADDRFLMVLSLPGMDNAALLAMDADAASDLAIGSELLQTRVFAFECGCNPDRMLTTVRALFDKRADELFLGEDRVETSCPRCGRHWWITRDKFDARQA